MLDATKLARDIRAAKNDNELIKAIGVATSEISRAVSLAVNPTNKFLIPIIVATLRRMADGYERTGMRQGISAIEFICIAKVVETFSEISMELPVEGGRDR